LLCQDSNYHIRDVFSAKEWNPDYHYENSLSDAWNTKSFYISIRKRCDVELTICILVFWKWIFKFAKRASFSGVTKNNKNDFSKVCLNKFGWHRRIQNRLVYFKKKTKHSAVIPNQKAKWDWIIGIWKIQNTRKWRWILVTWWTFPLIYPKTIDKAMYAIRKGTIGH